MKLFDYFKGRSLDEKITLLDGATRKTLPIIKWYAVDTNVEVYKLSDTVFKIKE